MNTSADVHGQKTEGRTCSLGKKKQRKEQHFVIIVITGSLSLGPTTTTSKRRVVIFFFALQLLLSCLIFFRANVDFASHPPHSFLLYFGFGGGGAFFSKHASIFLWVFSTRSLGVLWLRFLSFFFWCEVEKGEGEKSRKRRKC